jgi:hypothetical protein
LHVYGGTLIRGDNAGLYIGPETDSVGLSYGTSSGSFTNLRLYWGKACFIGAICIETSNPRGYQLCVEGSAAKSQGGSSWATFSDARLKDIHGDYEPGLSEICQLTPVRFSYKQDNDQDLPAEGESVGVVAQQVRELLPEAVEENSDGYLMVNNDPIIWAMVNAIKELKAENETLRQRLDALEAEMVQHQLAVVKEVHQ